MKQRRATPYLDTQENLYSLLALTSYARSVAAQAPSVTVELGEHARCSRATLGGKQRMRVASAPVPAAGGDARDHAEGRGPLQRRDPVPADGRSRSRREAHGLDARARVPRRGGQAEDQLHRSVTSCWCGVDGDAQGRRAPPDGLRRAPRGLRGAQHAARDRRGRGRQADPGRGAPTARCTTIASTSRPSAARDGRYVHEFTIRAIAVGTFVRPPTVAELMYEPAINAPDRARRDRDQGEVGARGS